MNNTLEYEFLRKRETARGWMQLVIRAWREEVELSQPAGSNDTDKWKVRRTGDKDEAYRNKRILRATKREKEEAAKTCVRAGTRATPSTVPEILTETPAKARLAQVVDSLRAQQETAQAGGRQK